MNKVSVVILYLMMCSSPLLFAQYVTPDGRLDNKKIIEELKKYDDNYAAQDSVANYLSSWILHNLNNGPLRDGSELIRSLALQTVSQIESRSGKYEFLSRDFRLWRDVPAQEVAKDTATERIQQLEKNWDRFLDSIKMVSQELFDIANNIRVTREDRDHAARLMGKTTDPAMMEYIFQNDRHYRFGGFTYDPFSWEDCWGCNRSAMGGLVFDKITRYHRDGSGENHMKNWTLFPLFMKYWGDTDYDRSVQTDMFSDYKLDILAFIGFIDHYQKPWLLVEFMIANAKNPQTLILQHFSEVYFKHKTHYESLQNTNTK